MAVRVKGTKSPKAGAKSISRGTRVRTPRQGVRKPSLSRNVRSVGKGRYVKARTSIRARKSSRAKIPTVAQKSASRGYLRQKAVRQAWRQEAELVRKTGRGTRDWTPRQLDRLRKGKKVPGYVGHHIRDVSSHSKRWTGDPRNIKLVTERQHLKKEHRGSFRNPTTGKLIDRQKMLRNRLQRRTPQKKI